MTSDTVVLAMTRRMACEPAAFLALGVLPVDAGPFSLLCGRPSKLEAMPPSARALAVRQHHARLLELLLEADLPVLATDRPVAIEDRQALIAAFEDAEPLLSRNLERYGRKVEFEIILTADPQRLVQGLSLAGGLRDLNGLPAATLACKLETLLQSHRDEVAHDAFEKLSAAAEAATRKPGIVAEIVLHASVMGERTLERELDRVLESIDGCLDGRCDIRCLGPIPARSFVALSLEEITAERLLAARASLRLGPADRGEGAIEVAFRRMARAAHPDSRGAFVAGVVSEGTKSTLPPDDPRMDLSVGALKAARDLLLLEQKRAHEPITGQGRPRNLVRLDLVQAPELESLSVLTAA